MHRPLPISGLALAALSWIVLPWTALVWAASGALAQTPPPTGTAVPVLGGGLAPGQDVTPTPKTGAALGSVAYIRRDRLECADFSRKSDATWTANRAVALPAPEGILKVDRGAVYRIGQFYGGYDLAAMLEHDCPKG